MIFVHSNCVLIHKVIMCVSVFTDVSRGDSRDPQKEPAERKEKDCGIYYPKLHLVSTQVHNNLHPNPSASPKSPHHFVYPYNGSSPVTHTNINSSHSLDTLRRLHHYPLPASSVASPNSSFSAPSTAQMLNHSPTSPNISHGQRTPKTPETPSSPRLTPLSSPPPSSPITLSGGKRGAQTHPHSPLSPSPSVHIKCVSSHQRSRHLSASPSSLSERGGSSTAAEVGGLMGSNVAKTRKSASSSPHSVSSGSPNPSPHVPKYKLEDILEQYKNSGNSSTNNHHFPNPANLSLLTNQSSSHPHVVFSKSYKGTMSPTASAGPPGFGLNSTGPSSLPLGPLLSHHYGHQGKLPHPVSFPASSLLSAAAKAQLANQITQGSNGTSNPGNLPSSLEILKETQQQQKVTNSTLHNSITSSPIASARLPHPSLAAASAVLFSPSQTLAQSLVSSSSHVPPPTERNASHRKRRRRSPTVLSMLGDAQPLANGLRKTPPEEAVSAAVINLSFTSCSLPSPSSHSYSTSAAQNQSAVTLDNRHQNLSGQMPRLSAPGPTAHLSRPSRPNEVLDFTTPTSLSLDPPTQPLSALLHFLSVQTAQAPASNSALAQSKTVFLEGSGCTNKRSPTELPSSPIPSFTVSHPQTQSPCRTDNTKPLSLVQKPLSSPPTSTHSTILPSHSLPPSTKPSPLQRDPSCILPPKSNIVFGNISTPSRQTPQSPLDKDQPMHNGVPTIDSVSQASLREASQHESVALESGSNSTSSSVDLSHSQGSVLIGIPSSPKPLDLSNNVLTLLAASSTVTKGEGISSHQAVSVERSSPENYISGKFFFFQSQVSSLFIQTKLVVFQSNQMFDAWHRQQK